MLVKVAIRMTGNVLVLLTILSTNYSSCDDDIDLLSISTRVLVRCIHYYRSLDSKNHCDQKRGINYQQNNSYSFLCRVLDGHTTFVAG